MLPSELQALEQRWLEFLSLDCLDLLEYDFWLSPPDDIDYEDPPILTAHDWNSGPCWDLAAAIRVWLGRSVTIDAIAVHGAARVGEWYLDGDGFSSPAQMHRRWSRNAAAHGRPRKLAPLPEAYLRDTLNADMVLSLARRMRSKLPKDDFLNLLQPEVEPPGL